MKEQHLLVGRCDKKLVLNNSAESRSGLLLPAKSCYVHIIQ